MKYYDDDFAKADDDFVKYYDFSKIYFVQSHLFCSANLKYFCFFYSCFSVINSP